MYILVYIFIRVYMIIEILQKSTRLYGSTYALKFEEFPPYTFIWAYMSIQEQSTYPPCPLTFISICNVRYLGGLPNVKSDVIYGYSQKEAHTPRAKNSRHICTRCSFVRCTLFSFHCLAKYKGPYFNYVGTKGYLVG